MKTYEAEISELQIWRIFLKIKAKNEEEAKEKAEQNVGEVISAKMREVDYSEVIQIVELVEE